MYRSILSQQTSVNNVPQTRALLLRWLEIRALGCEFKIPWDFKEIIPVPIFTDKEKVKSWQKYLQITHTESAQNE